MYSDSLKTNPNYVQDLHTKNWKILLKELNKWKICVHGLEDSILLKDINSKTDLHSQHACLHAQSLQLCPPLWDLRDCSPPSSLVQGILQARILERVTISYLYTKLKSDSLNPLSFSKLFWLF